MEQRCGGGAAKVRRNEDGDGYEGRSVEYGVQHMGLSDDDVECMSGASDPFVEFG